MNARLSTPRWLLGTGTRVAAITDHVATMVDLDDRDVSARLWEAQSASGADGALEVLLGGGIVAIPDFVLIEIEGDTYRVVIRGKARVTADTEAGMVTYEGANVRLAAEHVIASPASVIAGFGGTVPDLVPHDGTTGGTLLAADCAISSGFGFFDWIAAFATSYSLDMPTLNPPTVPVAGDMPAGDRDDVEAVDSSDGEIQWETPYLMSEPDGAAQPPPISDAVVPTAVVADVPDVRQHEVVGDVAEDAPLADVHQHEVVGVLAEDAPLADVHQHEVVGVLEEDDQDADVQQPQVESQPDADVQEVVEIDTSELPEEFTPVDAPSVAVTVVPDAGEQEVEGEPDSDGRYASIFGATVQRSVIDAAIREVGDEGADAGTPEIEQPVDGVEPPVASEVSSAPLESADASAEVDRPFAGLSQVAADNTMPPFRGDVDGHTLPPNFDDEQTLYPTAEAPLGDHDGHTVSRSDLPSTGSPATMWGSSGGVGADGSATADLERPHVQAIRCAGGHDNPPHRSECGRCHQPLDSEPVMIPRPPLGTLTFSTGEELVLDRPILVGRKPDIAGLASTELPVEFALDVGDGLSRSHALFTIAGWQVRVEDLGSTNHTTIRLPEQAPQRLRVGEPVPITDGTLIDLGGEVTCRYDVNI